MFFNTVDWLDQHVSPWRYFILLFLVSRIILTCIGIGSEILLDPFHGKENVWHYSSVKALDVWGVWDTGWYISIAKHGYSAHLQTESGLVGQANYAFFPMYPALIFLFSLVLRNEFISGLVVSNIFFIGSTFLLYKLVRLDYEEDVAVRTVKYLFMLPTAFILSGVFSESVYLFLVLACFYTFRLQKWLWTTLCAFFLALTRPPGIFIIVPLVFEYLFLRNSYNFSKKIYKIVGVLLSPIIGFGLFVLYNKFLTDDFFAFIHVQSAWGRAPINPVAVLVYNFFSKDISIFFAVHSTIASLVLLSVVLKKIRLSYLVFAIYSIFIPLSSGLTSMPRYISVVFPLALSCAFLTKKERYNDILLVSLALLQGFLMVFWSNGFSILM
jgi:hypothetical protein